jgi:hypothetical protein
MALIFRRFPLYKRLKLTSLDRNYMCPLRMGLIFRQFPHTLSLHWKSNFSYPNYTCHLPIAQTLSLFPKIFP